MGQGDLKCAILSVGRGFLLIHDQGVRLDAIGVKL